MNTYLLVYALISTYVYVVEDKVEHIAYTTCAWAGRFKAQ